MIVSLHRLPAERRILRVIAAAVLLCSACAPLGAHPAISASALARIDADGSIRLTLSHDALSFALNDTPRHVSDAAMYELLDGTDELLTQTLADARDRFASLFVLTVDGRRNETRISEFPSTAMVRVWQKSHPDRRLPLKLDVVVQAQLPPDARVMSLRFPDVLGDVILTVDRPGVEPISFPVVAGDATPAIEITRPPRTSLHRNGSPGGTARQSDDIGPLGISWRFLRMGFTHIVPFGADHVLFVLGLFFLNPTLRALIWQTSAFTIAHTLTLALSMLGYVELSPRIVEPLITASIVLVAIENLMTSRVHAWRPLVVFAFGLIHGMGFAGALRESGLPRGPLSTALISFNVGVELGQLTIILAALALVGRWRKEIWYRRAIAIPASLTIAIVGIAWTVQRLV